MAIQKIQGQQPFQVLATNFSIGPSNEGYTLQISADGTNYSNLFTVGSGVTRLVTGVANGSYYRLSGNNSEVSINWRTQCNDGGSGGGSGSGSTVSVNQILSAGTEIAQITVDGVPTSLYAPEGGSAEGGVLGIDYSELVSGATFPVDEIISAATEGDLVYMTYKPNGISNIKYLYLRQLLGTSQKSFFFSGNGDDGYRYSATLLYDTSTGILTPSEVTRTPIGSGNNFYDIAAIEDAEYSSRRALFAEWVDKVNAEENVSVSGICQTNNRKAILPLTRIYSGTSYTEGYGYNQGWAEFAAIIDGRWYYYQMSSVGNITGTVVGSGGNKNKLFLASGNTFYNLPVASQSTLGGVKAGSGVTIDSNGVISAQGGGSGDYQVVTELPASAEEGQLFYVPEHIQTTTYSGTALDCSAISEGYCFWVKRITDNNETAVVYRSGTDFYWGWTNDGEYHMKTDAEVPIRYQTDNANGIFNIWILGEGYYLDLTNDVASAATADYSYSVTVADATYRYLDNQFVMEPAAITYNVSTGTTVAEWTALYNKLLIMTEEQRANVSLLYFGDDIRPSTENGTYVKFLYNEFVADTFYFNGIAQSLGGSAEYTAPVAAKIAINNGNTPSFTWSQLTIGLNIEVDPNTHNLNFGNFRDYTWFSIYRTLARPASKDIPVTIKLNYKKQHFNATTISNASEALIALNEVYDGVRYEAEWRLANDNQEPTLLYWKESPVYQVVSALTDAGVNIVTFEDNKLTLPQSFISSLTGETDLLIYGGYPEDAYSKPIKLTSDGTNVNMYWGEQYNTGGTYTFVASGACANGTTIVYNNQGDFTCAISTSGSDYVFTLSSPWGGVASNPFYIPEIISYIEGQLVYTKDTHKLQVYNGTTWDVLN